MAFDFSKIEGPEDSRQDNFSSMCSRLIMRLDETAKPVDGSGGDEGLDTLVGTINGRCKVYQHKYFIDRLTPSARQQVKSSLKTCAEKHQPTLWVLMLPIDLTPGEIKWFEGLKEEYEFELDWWGKTKLQDLLGQHDDISHDFAPRPTIAVFVVGPSATDPATLAAKIVEHITQAPTADLRRAATDVASSVRDGPALRISILTEAPGGSDLYRKSREVRDRLVDLGHELVPSDVFLQSEMRAKSGLSLAPQEVMEALTIDYLLCFAEGPQLPVQLEPLLTDRKFASRITICCDRISVGEQPLTEKLYIFEGLHGRVEWFAAPTDLHECHLATRVLTVVEQVRSAKKWEMSQREA